MVQADCMGTKEKKPGKADQSRKNELYKLRMSEEQAAITITACEFYVKVRGGQIEAILDHTLDDNLPKDEFLRRHAAAQQLLEKAKPFLFPDGTTETLEAKYAFKICQCLEKSLVKSQIVRQNSTDTHGRGQGTKTAANAVGAMVDHGSDSSFFDESENCVVVLTLYQAKIVARACEFYARVLLGQFNEIVWNTLFAHDSRVAVEQGGMDICVMRDEAEKLLFEARAYIYPELYGRGHSYGIGKFRNADLSYDVYQVLREQWGDPRGTFSYYQLPKCEIIQF